MPKVVPLFKIDSVQSVLCEAADMGLTEVVLFAKKQDGGYWIRFSPCSNAFEQVGMIEAAKHELLAALNENAEQP